MKINKFILFQKIYISGIHTVAFSLRWTLLEKIYWLLFWSKVSQKEVKQIGFSF